MATQTLGPNQAVSATNISSIFNDYARSNTPDWQTISSKSLVTVPGSLS